MLTLSFGLKFEDLYSLEGIGRLDLSFLNWLKEANFDLYEELIAGRANPGQFSAADISSLILKISPHLDDFIAVLFGIEAEVLALSESHLSLAPIYVCKRLFVQRRAVKKFSGEIQSINPESLRSSLRRLIGIDPFGEEGELVFSKEVNSWINDEGNFSSELEIAGKYAAWATLTEEGKTLHGRGVLFKVPEKLNPEKLLPVKKTYHKQYEDNLELLSLPDKDLRERDGFVLTDEGHDLVQALDQANYCIFCHNQGKDSCSHGLKEKSKEDNLSSNFKKNNFGITLSGCPLEEKISEMHSAKVAGQSIAALAIAMIDNPMIAATGHRICNDCMKSCIYQRQEPVDIPQVETRVLKDVLNLSWGFEIYSLLTRWVPLDLNRPVPRKKTNRKVLVAGMGPAGFTLSHHLINDGHSVVGIDGLKIEPLPSQLSGVKPDGSRVSFNPIRDVNELYESLDDRIMAGFGGVAEYGITVRWNKNYLKLIRLLLERREAFTLFGGVRFGGTITIDKAFEIGFDHIALAMGAGKPTILDLPNGLARGVRAASDFLMGLQLTGAARSNSIANMQLRLPVVVVGGGLTAIDTATESMAYYPIQVEKFLSRYETLVTERGEDSVQEEWDSEDLSIASEFIDHARAIRDERDLAKLEGRTANIRKLLQGWGGVTIAYRKNLSDSPSYTLNHEEVGKAFEEGIFFAEKLSPTSIEIDKYGHSESIKFNKQELTFGEQGAKWTDSNATESLPAKSILIAAGTRPNTVLSREDRGIKVQGKFFQAIDDDGNIVSPEQTRKPEKVEILTSFKDDGRAITFFGDLHPSFAGNVVGAMSSAKQGYPRVSELLNNLPENDKHDDNNFLSLCNSQFRSTVFKVNRLTPTIVEIIIKSPAVAKAFKPGQFFRLQNFETFAPKTSDTILAMEGLAMTGAWVDRDLGLVGTIALEMGGSSDICALLAPGEPVILMGPTGEPTNISKKETVLLVGGGLGNAVLFSIGRAMRERGSRVLYFAGYREHQDRYKTDEIEAASNYTVWSVDNGKPFEPTRKGDLSFSGNIVDAMVAYSNGDLGKQPISLSEVDRIITIGSDRMMAAVASARHGVLKPLLKKDHVAIGSINSPMQCMMKEVCAQCLQPQVDPITGERKIVFSCFNQDQDLDKVDFYALNQRLRQNAVQEKLTKQWIDHSLREIGIRL